MSELIASGASQSSVVDFTVTAGTPKALYIYYTSSSQDVAYRLFKKSSASAYQLIDTLTPQNIVDKGVIYGPGTYGVQRMAGANASSLEAE